jgi:hypothetical protein
MIMLEQIHEILCAITSLCATSEIKGVLPTAILYDIAKFTEYVIIVFFWMARSETFWQNTSEDRHLSQSTAENGKDQATVQAAC